MPALITLQIADNLISTIDLTGCTNLREFDCAYTQLTELDLSSVPNLVLLGLSATKISTLDLSANTSLTTIIGNNTYLTGLDLTGLVALANLELSSNEITTVDVSPAVGLTTLHLTACLLTSDAVNHILAALVANAQLGGICALTGQTPAAPPTTGPPDGIAAKAALKAEDPAWTVTTDT